MRRRLLFLCCFALVSQLAMAQPADWTIWDMPSEQSVPGNLGWMSYPITFLWVIGVTNSINIIDGLDGLACGVSLIALVTFLILGLRQNLEALSLISIALAGSMLAFLRFNFYPAKIFLGDSGSTFTGFMLASVGALWVLNSGNACVRG